jgi:hypothetical protein
MLKTLYIERETTYNAEKKRTEVDSDMEFGESEEIDGSMKLETIEACS